MTPVIRSCIQVLYYLLYCFLFIFVGLIVLLCQLWNVLLLHNLMEIMVTIDFLFQTWYSCLQYILGDILH
jgi:hypothetical protein